MHTSEGACNKTRHPEPHGPGFWVVSKYADVRAVSLDPVTYSSDQDRGGVTPLEEPETPTPRPGAKVLIAMDPPEHTRYRKLVNRGFTPRLINALEPRIREMAVRILDRAIADPFRFDIERRPNEHVAFGGGGSHFCLGASLARLEIRVLFEELARRVPVLRSLRALARLRSNIVAGIKHLPVDLSATPVRSR